MCINSLVRILVELFEFSKTILNCRGVLFLWENHLFLPLFKGMGLFVINILDVFGKLGREEIILLAPKVERVFLRTFGKRGPTKSVFGH